METIKKSSEFSYIYNKGDKIFTKYTIIFVKQSQEQKFGFVTSKKSGNAVKRNRLRRIFRSVIRMDIDKFRADSSYIIVANKRCKDDFESLNYNILKKDILFGLKRYEKSISKNN